MLLASERAGVKEATPLPSLVIWWMKKELGQATQSVSFSALTPFVGFQQGHSIRKKPVCNLSPTGSLPKQVEYNNKGGAS